MVAMRPYGVRRQAWAYPRLVHTLLNPAAVGKSDRMNSSSIWVAMWLACLAILGGCRALQFGPTPPLESGIAQGQLVFHSDFPLPNKDGLVRDVVAEHDDVCRTLALPDTAEPIHVHLFRDHEQYAQFVKRHYPLVPQRRAFFLETDTRLAVYAQWSDRLGEDLRHEVAHGYLHAVLPNLPLWLDEGLAEYFEVPRGHEGLNPPHVELLGELIEHEGWKPNLEKLETITDCAKMTQQHYAEAWAWVHFLLQSEPARRDLLQGYLADLRRHGTAEPFSLRLATLHVEPERTLQEYVIALREEQN
jgi:hypothetical protein